MSDIVSLRKNYDATDRSKNFSFEGFDKYHH